MNEYQLIKSDMENMIEIELYALGAKAEAIVPQLCFIFNSVQSYYRFHIGNKLPTKSLTATLTRKELIELVKTRTRNGTYVNFLVHDFPDEKDWYATYPDNGISLITTNGWEEITNDVPQICSIGSSVIQILQDYEIHRTDGKITQEDLENLWGKLDQGLISEDQFDRKLIHFKSIQCLNDFCGEKKEDKVLRIRTGDLCSTCYNVWEKNLLIEQIDALYELIEAIRSRAVLNRGHIRARSKCRDQVAQIEVALHSAIEITLKTLFKADWWVNGVEEKDRIKIAESYEHGNCIGEKFEYTNLIDLGKIWDRNYSQFIKLQPFINWGGISKKGINEIFTKLNRIRNNLMHAPHKYNPSQADLDFLDDIAGKLYLT